MTGTNGQQWTELSDGLILPFTTGASDVVRDPNRTSTYYVAAPNAGVFRTDDNGNNWTRIDNLNTAITGIAGSNNIEIALFDAGATTVTYIGVVSGIASTTSPTDGALSGVFRYAEDGVDSDGANGVDDAGETTWTAIGTAPAIHPGNQGFNNFSIVADPTQANLVYVGGDTQPVSPFVANIVRGNSNTGNWTPIAPGPGATSPHPQFAVANLHQQCPD